MENPLSGVKRSSIENLNNRTKKIQKPAVVTPRNQPGTPAEPAGVKRTLNANNRPDKKQPGTPAEPAVVSESETSNSEEPCVCIDPIIHALKEHFIFILNEEPEPPTPIEKINKLYRLDEHHYSDAISELIEESKRDEELELKKYLFAYLCDNYDKDVDVVDKNIVLTNKENKTFDLKYIYNYLLQLNFIYSTDNFKAFRDWFKIYSCGPNRNILKKLNEEVEANEILKYFQGIGLTPHPPPGNLEDAKTLMKQVKDILFYVAELRMTNFEYIGFNIQNYAGVLDTLHSALKDMYEIEHLLLLSASGWSDYIQEKIGKYLEHIKRILRPVNTNSNDRVMDIISFQKEINKILKIKKEENSL